MKSIYPQKLQKGDEVRVIAPSSAFRTTKPEVIEQATRRFKELGLNISWGKSLDEIDIFESSAIESRIRDLHEAFVDPNVKAIFAVRGGWNANQLLNYIDWEVIRNNPKIFCGFSDITILHNSIFSQTGLVTYSGPNFTSLGRDREMEYTVEYFKKCLMADDSFTVEASKFWFDWELGTTASSILNTGWTIFNEGEASGLVLGGNLCTFNLLQGTRYMPNIAGAILCIEEDSESTYKTIDRDFQSLLHVPNFEEVKGLIIGRFQLTSDMNPDRLKQMIAIRPELRNIPVIANVDIGHTAPLITFPVGGEIRMKAAAEGSVIEVVKH